jgi:N-acetylneuraminic acid mutarotase
MEGYAGTWKSGPYFHHARGRHGAALLPDDRVLLVGGEANMHATSTDVGMEIFDLSPTGKITTYPKMERRIGHTVSRLPSGKIVVVGGTEAEGPMVAEPTLLYDPSASKWSFPAGPATNPVHHTATVLADGTVLLIGGRRNGFTISPVEADVGIYDPEHGAYRALPPLREPRADHTATLLADGRVLVVGGIGRKRLLGDAALLDPHQGVWTAVPGAMPRANHTATRLEDGRVLIVGGTSKEVGPSVQLFLPGEGRFVDVTPLSPDREEHTATLLPDGQVLVAGGYVRGSGATADASVFLPAQGTWCRLSPMSHGRSGHTATGMSDGSVLIAGGTDLASNADDRAGMDPYVRSTEILARR